MADTPIDIDRIHDLAATIEAGGVIDNQWAFATDTKQIIARDGANYYHMAGIEASNSFTASNTFTNIFMTGELDVDTGMFQVTPTGIVINDQGVAAGDVRIESNNQPQMFFLDSGAEEILIAGGDTAAFTTEDITFDMPFYANDSLDTSGLLTVAGGLTMDDSSSIILSGTTNITGTAFSVTGSTGATNTGDLTVGSGAIGVDNTLTFHGETNSFVMTNMEDEGALKMSSEVIIDGSNKLSFNALTANGTFIKYDSFDLLIHHDGSGSGADIRIENDCGDFLFIENSSEILKYSSNDLEWQFGERLTTKASTSVISGLGITPGADKTSFLEDGDLWLVDSNFKLRAGGITKSLDGTIFVQTADQTIANTVTETTMLGSGSGTLTLPADFWTVGKCLSIDLHGDFADSGTPTAEVQAYFGATSLIDSGATTLSGLSATEKWKCSVRMTCRSVGATGTIEATLDFEYETTTGSSPIQGLDTAGKLTVVDTTAAGAMDVTFEWGTASASNTLTSQISRVAVYN
jgi:hypothetical protein